MNRLIDQVDDGFNYFNDRLEELKTDDAYYIKAFMKYIEVLESKPSIDWWDDSEKITHEGYVYVRTKDIIK